MVHWFSVCDWRCGSSDALAVSCVNPVKTDWQKGVQLWTCTRDTGASEVR